MFFLMCVGFDVFDSLEPLEDFEDLEDLEDFEDFADLEDLDDLVFGVLVLSTVGLLWLESSGLA